MGAADDAPEELEAYNAPLLSRSGVHAVQLLRDQLDLAVASAVRSSGDAGLIIRWLYTDMSGGDFAAVDALRRLLGHGDPRYLAFRASSALGRSAPPNRAVPNSG